MIVLASAKTMKPSKAGKQLPVFLNQSMILRKQLKKKSKEQLSTYFNIKGKTLDNTYYYFQEKVVGNVLDSLNGVVFREISARNHNYIQNNVFIIDALYGLLNGNDQIELYRLDFNCKSLVDVSLYKYWTEHVNYFVKNHPSTQLLVLSSNEYTKLLNIKSFNKDIFTIDFDKSIKSSTEKKQVRGKICNYCILNQIEDYTLLNQIEIENYYLILLENRIVIKKSHNAI